MSLVERLIRVVGYGGVLTCVLATGAGHAFGQWPQFRGPNGSGVDSSEGYPAVFSPARNVVWKTPVPHGQSSPVVADGHLYVTASHGDLLLTVCLDAETGRELWRRGLRRSRVQKVYRANDPASPTAVADTDGVVVFFPDFGLAAYTSDGKDRWTVPLGPFHSFYGMAGSPIVAADLVILLCDQRMGSFVLAVDRRTGRQRWKQGRTSSPEGWATPIVFRPAAGPTQLIVLGSTRLDSYALETGESRWWMPIGSSGAMGTVVTGGETLYLSTVGGSEPSLPTFDAVLDKYDGNKDRRLSHAELLLDKELGEHFGWIDADSDDVITETEWKTTRNLGSGASGAVAIRPEGARGALDASSVLWRFERNLPYIPAPLLYQNVLYLVKTGGIVTSLDPATGRLLKEGRAPGALGPYYASPVAADGKVFLTSTEGKITVLKAAGDWQVLEVNDIGEEIHATPALAGGRVFVRTRSSMYCFGGN
ncbi:MAG TPA: PQQ-binding-like beta-propeller repeat protein [Vicinamibacterales bacterium]|nr:PQQ-binding-like beta-propeller repeat protein [Vicinamibacterales bacterium]